MWTSVEARRKKKPDRSQRSNQIETDRHKPSESRAAPPWRHRGTAVAMAADDFQQVNTGLARTI